MKHDMTRETKREMKHEIKHDMKHDMKPQMKHEVTHEIKHDNDNGYQITIMLWLHSCLNIVFQSRFPLDSSILLPPC